MRRITGAHTGFSQISAPAERLPHERSDSACNLTGTQTAGTNIYMAGRIIDDRLDTFYIGFPGTIAAPMRVGNLDTERNALVAKLALCHPLHLLAVAY